MEFTPFGRIIRAGSRDPEMVGLLGINLPLVLTGVFGLGCLLAGLAGMLAGPLWTVQPSMSAGAIMPAFVIVTIGGLGSFAGAIVAGLMVGVVTAHHHPVRAGLVGRRHVHPDGGGAVAAAARTVRRALGALRMSLSSRLLAPDTLDRDRPRRAERGLDRASAFADLADHADRDLYAVWRRREPAGRLHRPGAVRRLGLLRLRQLRSPLSSSSVRFGNEIWSP